MKEFTFSLDLYGLYDRAYEDCTADVTIEVPDSYEHHAPKIDEVRVSEITIPSDTRDYLEGTFHTDIDELIRRIGKDMDQDSVYSEFLEQFGSDWDEAKYDEWAETATLPEWEETGGKSLEITDIVAVTQQLLESVKP